MRTIEFVNSFKDTYYNKMKKVSEKYHLRLSELDIILFLSENKEYNTVTKISQHFHMLKSLVCMTIHSLNIKGLVSIDKVDNSKKINFINLTNKTLPIIEDAMQIESNINNILYFGFTDFQKQKINEKITKMANNINEYKMEDDKKCLN